jgi:hypothetical protein
MEGFMFRMTITSYWRGIRVFKTWKEPNIYPSRSITVILGYISFLFAIRDEGYPV